MFTKNKLGSKKSSDQSFFSSVPLQENCQESRSLPGALEGTDKAAKVPSTYLSQSFASSTEEKARNLAFLVAQKISVSSAKEKIEEKLFGVLQRQPEFVEIVGLTGQSIVRFVRIVSYELDEKDVIDLILKGNNSLIVDAIRESFKEPYSLERLEQMFPEGRIIGEAEKAFLAAHSNKQENANYDKVQQQLDSVLRSLRPGASS